MGSLTPPPPAPAATRVRPKRPLHDVIPPLILGTATFNTQYVDDPYNEADLPALAIVSRALDLGVNAFDTSPYYGPSELILGAALSHPSVRARHPRDSYFLVTKAGRIHGDVFDYSPAWIRYSVLRSLERLHTDHLDLVYTHDVEFVSPQEVLAAVTELRRLRDEGLVRHVGISGFPVDTLCSLAEMILRETGEPLDAVLSYGHCTLQCTTLGSSQTIRRFADAGVDVVLNASMLGMGLLTTRGVDAGPMAKWHPSPHGLREACAQLVRVAADAKEKLEVVAIRWALDTWSRLGSPLGTSSSPLSGGSGSTVGRQRVGVSVMGVSSVAELEETQRVFNSVLEGLDDPDTPASEQTEAAKFKRQWSLNRVNKVQGVVEQMWQVLGTWKDYAWSSPEPGFKNQRRPEDAGVVPQDDGVMTRYREKVKRQQQQQAPQKQGVVDLGSIDEKEKEVVEVSVHEVQPVDS